tara:strand:- start:224 stop:766 length:543 start_codon:yes stop_codon:yes gene_type:complete
MIEQIPLYVLCYVLGWVPLGYIHSKVQASFPFKLLDSKAIFSVLPFIMLGYLALEVARGVAVVYIAHQWLVGDIDLLIGVGLFVAGVCWPVRVSKQWRSYLWLPCMGVYGALFSIIGWLFPVFVAMLYCFQLPQYIVYSLSALVFVVVGIFNGANSLYVALYVGLSLLLGLGGYFNSARA